MWSNREKGTISRGFFVPPADFFIDGKWISIGPCAVIMAKGGRAGTGNDQDWE